MNADKAFIDTNVLVYMFDDDVAKLDRAWEMICAHECVISVQVAMEFCSVCGRRLKMTSNEIKDALHTVRKICSMRPVTAATIDRALDVRSRYGYSFYDSVMVASALEHGCRYLLSEDMKHRQTIESTMILNIFAA